MKERKGFIKKTLPDGSVEVIEVTIPSNLKTKPKSKIKKVEKGSVNDKKKQKEKQAPSVSQTSISIERTES